MTRPQRIVPRGLDLGVRLTPETVDEPAHDRIDGPASNQP